MKKLLLALFFIPAISFSQVRSITATGVNLALTATSSITNTITPLTIAQDTIKANTMANYKKVSFRGVLSVTSALTNPTMSFVFKLGSSTITLASGLSISLSLSAQPILIEGYFKNRGATNSQFVYIKVSQGSTLVLGLGGNVAIYTGTMSVDTTLDQLFSITAGFGSALTGTTLTLNDFEINRDL